MSIVVVYLVILVAAFFFLVVRPINALLARTKKGPEPVATAKECPYCLSSIPLAATKCAFCTADLPAAA